MKKNRQICLIFDIEKGLKTKNLPDKEVGAKFATFCARASINPNGLL